MVIKMEEFVREKIKDKPLNKKKIATRLVMSALNGFVFALVACLTIALFWPKITGANEATQTDVSDATILEPENIQLESQYNVEDDQFQGNKTEVFNANGITLDDYQKIQSQLYAIANTVNKSVVAITGVSSDTDWFNNSYEKEYQGTGVVISDNGNELLILSERKIVQDAKSISVTFINDDTVEATVRKMDANTGIVVLSVQKKDLEDGTLNAISVATFGNSNSVTKGSITIALGSPLGTCYSILIGNITSNDNAVSTLDYNYSVFTTDIVASESGSGILINVKGEVTGLIKQDFGSATSGNTLTAIGISEVKPVIEMLINDKSIPYIGIYGTTVTDRIAKKYLLPKGIYVKEVEMDSPAMTAGIQSGDVITEINGVSVSTISSYYAQVLALDVEQEYSLKLQRKAGTGYNDITIQVKPGVLK